MFPFCSNQFCDVAKNYELILSSLQFDRIPKILTTNSKFRVYLSFYGFEINQNKIINIVKNCGTTLVFYFRV